jgi:Recombinase
MTMTTNLTTEGRARGRVAGNRQQADKAVSEYWDLVPDLFRMRAHGATLRDIAANLNERGIRTRMGADWSQVQVKRLLDRVGSQVEFVIQRYSAVGWYDFQGGFDTYLDAEQAMGNLGRKKEYRIEVYSKSV